MLNLLNTSSTPLTESVGPGSAQRGALPVQPVIMNMTLVRAPDRPNRPSKGLD